MKLTSFRLKNYKSFKDSGVLNFSNGFNVIVGQNNAGKSALLQGIGLNFTNTPHKSLESKPTENSVLDLISIAEFSIECSGIELREILLREAISFHLPIPKQKSKLTGNENFQIIADEVLNRLFSEDIVMINLHQTGDLKIHTTSTPSFASYVAEDKHLLKVISQPYQKNFKSESLTHFTRRNLDSEIGAVIGQIFRGQIYWFTAERVNLGVCPTGDSEILKSNAENLPEVLLMLQANIGRFNQYNKYINQVFPTIYHVSAKPIAGGKKTQIYVWPVDPETHRDDLAISLDDSGTGVGQVLAILYVAITSQATRTIIIDEPNTFLNPGAAKKLIEILRGFPKLQFIISTHSPEILRESHAQTLSLIQWGDGKSTVSKINTDEITSMQLVLKEVGSSLSDVFGADRVLWVEGQTEEYCFPLIIERILGKQLKGTAIVAVIDVDRLANPKRSAALILGIYSKLSNMGALMPPALAFSFDIDGRTKKDINDIRRQSENKVHFLPRQMFENYLLDADAIADVITAETNSIITSDEVQKIITERRDDYLLSTQSESADDQSAWLYRVDGARLLKEIFDRLSNSTVSLSKTQRGVKLIKWLIDNKPKSLNELAEYLDGLLSAK